MMTNDELSKLFESNGFVWSYKDEDKRTPSPHELSETIRKVAIELNADPDATQIEFGRLVIKKNGSFIDVFVHAQEFRRDGL